VQKKTAAFVDRIHLESLLQTVQNVVEKPHFKTLFIPFRATSPNGTHDALARLAAAGYVSNIITTNFDCNIEASLAEHRVPFNVSVTERDFGAQLGHDSSEEEAFVFSPTLALYEQAMRWPAKERKPSDTDRRGKGHLSVVKLHGCCRRPQTIVATMERVTTGLSSSCCRVVIPQLVENMVVFIGWSDGDIDITPLTSIRSDLPSYWLHHNPTGAVPRHVSHLARARGARVLRSNVPRFVNALADRLTPDAPRKARPERRLSWRDRVRAWSNRVRVSECDAIAADLLRRAGHLDESLELARRVIRARGVRTRARMTAALSCARTHLVREERNEARQVLGRLRRSPRLNKRGARIILEEARTFCHTKYQERAEKSIARVASWAAKHDEPWPASYCALHCATASFQREGTVSTAMIRDTELWMTRSGNFEGLIDLLILLAQVSVPLGQYVAAVAYGDRATQLADAYGDAVLSVTAINCRGAILAQTGDFDQARLCFSKAIRSSKALRLPAESGLACMNLAIAWKSDEMAWAQPETREEARSLMEEAERILMPLELRTYSKMLATNLALF
jgi:tetratricopeptide (TPR) repeat protein